MLITTRRSLRRIGARLGRWPRRIACLACLLLAAGSALSPSAATSSAAAGRSGGVDALRAGEVAVPIAVSAGGTATVVRPGDRVGVLAGSSADGFTARRGSAVLVADQLRVLTVEKAEGGIGGDAMVSVVVATSRSGAVRIARFTGRPLLLIADQFP